MSDLIGTYLHHLELSGNSAETLTCRRRFLRQLQRSLGMPPELATSAELLDWRRSLTDTISDRSIIMYVSRAKCFYRWLVDEGYRDDNPAEKLPKPKPSQLLPRPIAEHDLAHALARAPQPIRIWLVLASWCGLRCKEIALLQRQNVLDAAVPPMLIVASDATKGHSERAIPLSRFVLEELAAYRLPRWGYVFPRADGKPGPNKPSRVSQMVGDYLRSLEITASAHMGRHRFGTETYRATQDIRLVQEILGHKSPVTTAGYVRVMRADLVAAMEALPAPAPGLRPCPVAGEVA